MVLPSFWKSYRRLSIEIRQGARKAYHQCSLKGILELLTFYLSKFPEIYKIFNEADFRFEQAIEPDLDLFDQEAIKFLIEQIENNDQLYR